MKKLILVLVSIFILEVSIISCAAMVTAPPALQNRVLLLNPDSPGFRYEYMVCLKTILGVCTKHGMHVDTYDLTDPTVRMQLINAGFVAQVAEKISP